MEVEARQKLKVNRLPGGKNLVIDINGITIGGSKPALMGGPCSVEIMIKSFPPPRPSKKPESKS